MNTKQISIIALIILALIQIYVPLQMILTKENVLRKGEEYKFKTIPVDPNDPFRGKYITLRYEQDMVDIYDTDKWSKDDVVYAWFESDNQGYAKIENVSKNQPVHVDFYIKTKVENVYANRNKMRIEYPFNRFYMEESKAKAAEDVYRKYASDSSKTTYAVVNIKDGEAVLKDVCIDGVPIARFVEEK